MPLMNSKSAKRGVVKAFLAFRALMIGCIAAMVPLPLGCSADIAGKSSGRYSLCNMGESRTNWERDFCFANSQEQREKEFRYVNYALGADTSEGLTLEAFGLSNTKMGQSIQGTLRTSESSQAQRLHFSMVVRTLERPARSLAWQSKKYNVAIDLGADPVKKSLTIVNGRCDVTSE